MGAGSGWRDGGRIDRLKCAMASLSNDFSRFVVINLHDEHPGTRLLSDGMVRQDPNSNIDNVAPFFPDFGWRDFDADEDGFGDDNWGRIKESDITRQTHNSIRLHRMATRPLRRSGIDGLGDQTRIGRTAQPRLHAAGDLLTTGGNQTRKTRPG